MSRSSWVIEKQNSSGTWVTDGNLFRPNETLSIEHKSNISKQVASDGSIVFINPKVNSTSEDIQFDWVFEDGTLLAKLKTYVNDSVPLRIIFSSTNKLKGKFTSITSNWLVGHSPDQYDITSTFTVMPNL